MYFPLVLYVFFCLFSGPQLDFAGQYSTIVKRLHHYNISLMLTIVAFFPLYSGHGCGLSVCQGVLGLLDPVHTHHPEHGADRHLFLS